MIFESPNNEKSWFKWVQWSTPDIKPIPWVRQLWLCYRPHAWMVTAPFFFSCTSLEFSFETSIHKAKFTMHPSFRCSCLGSLLLFKLLQPHILQGMALSRMVRDKKNTERSVRRQGSGTLDGDENKSNKWS